MVSEVRIRAFRATDDPEACHKFMEGHRRVLDIFGIEKVSSSNEEWGELSSVFVILVDSPDGEKVYGGARIHAVDGTNYLPMEYATGTMDSNIYKLVNKYSEFGCGELCGLWNSREVAGLGIGAFFATRAGIVITQQLGIKHLFALCAPYTVKFSMWMGCRVVRALGHNGTFYYPNIDLLATAVLLEDTASLENANESERNVVFNLRQNPHQIITEKVARVDKEVTIHYELQLHDVNDHEFKLDQETRKRMELEIPKKNKLPSYIYIR